MKNIWAVFVVATVFFASLSSCTPSETDNSNNNNQQTGGTVDIGVVLPTREEPRWLQDEAQFKKSIENSGKSVEVLFSQGDSQREKTNVETLISKGIDILILCPHDGDAAKDTAEYAASKGVQVISYDRLIKGTEKVDYYCTFDSLEVGRAQGQFLIDQAEGTGNNLYLYTGSRADNNSYLFFQGAWEVLQPKIADGTFIVRNSSEAEKLKDTKDLTRDQQSAIIGQTTTNWEERVAKQLAESNLAAVGNDAKETCFILAPNDPTSRAIGDVFRSDSAVKAYHITGQDAEKSSIEYILQGKQSMTVFKNTNLLANDAMQIAMDLLDGKEITGATATFDNGARLIPTKQTPIVVVTKENAYEKLIESEYYKAEDIAGMESMKK